MKVIFLDIDGVLNNGRWNNQQVARRVEQGDFEFRSEADMICPEAVQHLNRIIEATGALVVISSSWRGCFPMPLIEVSLRDRGFKGAVIGCTGMNGVHEGMTQKRGEEIMDWVKAVGHVESFVAIDDETNDEMEACGDSFVKTHYATGLLDTHVKKAIKILNDT